MLDGFPAGLWKGATFETVSNKGGGQLQRILQKWAEGDEALDAGWLALHDAIAVCGNCIGTGKRRNTFAGVRSQNAIMSSAVTSSR